MRWPLFRAGRAAPAYFALARRPAENNALLARGAQSWSIPAAAIARNVKECWSLGSCGMVPTSTNAVDAGHHHSGSSRQGRHAAGGNACRTTGAGRRQGVGAALVAVRPNRRPVQGGKTTTIAARHFGAGRWRHQFACRADALEGAGPARPAGCAHLPAPVVMSAAVLEQRVEGWAGAPRDRIHRPLHGHQPIDGPMGFKLEAPPLHPVILATTMPAAGSRVPIWPVSPPMCCWPCCATGSIRRHPVAVCQAAQ